MKYKLIIFDADGTLADRDSGQRLEGVEEYFHRLRSLPDEARPHVAVATNQGGVGMRHWIERGRKGNISRYPTRERIEKQYTRLIESLLEHIPYRLYVAYAFQSRSGEWSPTPSGYESEPRWNRQWRKPSPGMLLQAMEDAGAAPGETLMVGDREDDRLAAERAGCDFQWAHEFFGRDAPA